MYTLTFSLLFCYTSFLLIQKVLNIRLSSTIPSARRKLSLPRRSRERKLSCGDQNSKILIGSKNWTYRSNGHEQRNGDANFPNSITSVSFNEIRAENLFENLNCRIQRSIDIALNAGNSPQDHVMSNETHCPGIESGQKQQNVETERHRNDRAALEDSQLDTAYSCADLRFIDTNMETLALPTLIS